jgi:CBS domain-containing protein
MAKIREHVTCEVITLSSSATIAEAAQLMSERRVGSVAVSEGAEIIGLVTERDLVALVLANGVGADHPVKEAMRAGLPRISIDASESECATLMRDHYTRHLLVEEYGRVAGVVSMRDLIRLMLEEKQFLIEQLETSISGRPTSEPSSSVAL